MKAIEDKEIWKVIEGFGSKYYISNFGNVSGPKKKVLKLQTHKKGYLVVSLGKKDTKKTLKVHRLVGIAFIPNPNNFPQINHIDGNKKNNHFLNLEWATNSFNTKHAYDTGLIKKRYGKDAHAVTFGIEVINSNGEIIDILYGEKEKADKGYQSSNIARCLSGERRTHKNMTFRKKYL